MLLLSAVFLVHNFIYCWFLCFFFFRFGVTRLPPIAWSEFSCNLFYCWPSRELMHKTFKLIILLSQQHRLCARFIADWIRCGACRFSKKSLYCCCFRISLSRLCFDHNSILIKNIFFMYFCSKLVFTHSLISLFLLFLVWKMSNKTWFIFCDVSRALALISVLHPNLRVCLSLNFKAQSPTAAGKSICTFQIAARLSNSRFAFARWKAIDDDERCQWIVRAFDLTKLISDAT